MPDETYQTIALAQAREEIILAHLAAMGKALSLAEKFPTAIDTAVGGLERLHDEKFENVAIQFRELNTRLTEGDQYKKTALDAAMKAAQDRSEKTEQLFTKQIENLSKTVDDLRSTVKENSGGKRANDSLWNVIAIAAALLLSLGALIEQALRH